jgi:aryl-alcohol dehydrogenase-like predicted oxidoreductase
MRKIAERHNVPVSHVAYAWLFARPQVSSVIVGASRPDQLAGNLAAADFTLSGDEIAQLDVLDPPEPIYPDSRWLRPAG